MRSFNKLANLHRVFFKRAGPPIGLPKESEKRPPAPPRPIGLPKGDNERPGVPLEKGLSKKGPEERPTESPRTPKMMQKKGPVEIPTDPRRPQIPGLQKGNREDWDKNQRFNPEAEPTSGREPTQVELRHIMPNSGFKLDPKEPWKSDAGKLPVQFGSDEPKRTALNTAHTPEPYVPPPDDHMRAYQSNSEQKYDNYIFANPFGSPVEGSNRVFMSQEALRPNGPGSNWLPPSEIKQKMTLPIHLRRPPFDKKDPTYGLE